MDSTPLNCDHLLLNGAGCHIVYRCKNGLLTAPKGRMSSTYVRSLLRDCLSWPLVRFTLVCRLRRGWSYSSHA